MSAGAIYTRWHDEQGGLSPKTPNRRRTEKRIYALTPTGRKTLNEWFASGIEPAHQHDEFFIKLMIGLASGAADPYRVIQTQRAHLSRVARHHRTSQSCRSQQRTRQDSLLDKAICIGS